LGRLKDEFKVHLLCERVRGFCVRSVCAMLVFSVAVARRRFLAASAGQAQEKLVESPPGGAAPVCATPVVLYRERGCALGVEHIRGRSLHEDLQGVDADLVSAVVADVLGPRAALDMEELTFG